ncbi:hypothetical protein [Methylobacterium iners]|uniref:Uncharacterized protein n=1 Tax=Methylobacterium iners TaxID=418707 RepID=A0ABQ4RSG0_9HYPH|nr:hypothetical protein [Methylobacterium iners]GJD92912.1 hypothetical protein OCOJLMKI_0095 [Methylobacterium iners]
MLHTFVDEFVRTDEPQPPIIEAWRLALLFVAIAAIVWGVHVLVAMP